MPENQRQKPPDREKPTPRQLALGRLGRRECSRAEIEVWLVSKGVSPSEASQTAQELEKQGLIDDQRYARMMIRHQSLRGKGARYIALKLKQKGVHLDPRAIQEQSQELGLSSELELAREIVERRYPKAHSDRQVAAKAYNALLRRGFSSETARAAVFKR